MPCRRVLYASTPVVKVPRRAECRDAATVVCGATFVTGGSLFAALLSPP
jgi:hypothetical protein